MNKFKIIWFNIFSLLIIFYSSEDVTVIAQARPGDVFPSWSEGYLDIHCINTGKGESSFFVLPDGTTMLVDAGVALTPPPRISETKPNKSRTPGEWISRYIEHMTQPIKDKKLSYILVSHFHQDHMGGLRPEMKSSKSGTYRLSGITEVGDNIPFNKIIDRNWPDYNWPVMLDDEKMKNYQQFIKWHIENNKAVAEQFKVGHNDQIVLVNKPEKYPNFEIRNIAANGHVWTGFGSNEHNCFPELKDLDKKNYPPENKCSIAFRLSYGRFDYFSGGDLDVRSADTGGSADQWKDIETPVALVTGPVDVCKANHHGNYDANSVTFLRTLRPRVIIIHTWLVNQPDFGIWRRMISQETYLGPRDVYATNIMEGTRTFFGEEIEKMKSQNGHIVIRVNPGGESYFIYILDDSNENFEVKTVHGPYISN